MRSSCAAVLAAMKPPSEKPSRPIRPELSGCPRMVVMVAETVSDQPSNRVVSKVSRLAFVLVLDVSVAVSCSVM